MLLKLGPIWVQIVTCAKRKNKDTNRLTIGGKIMKKIFIESTIISLVLTVMLFSAIGTVFAAYPGPDDDTDDDTGGYGTWVTSAVHAEYGSPAYYDYVWWWSVRYNGTAIFYSDMYLWWEIDDTTIPYTVDSTYVSDGGDYYAYDHISSRTKSRFYANGYGWWLDATAIEYVTY
jgi:hypothetical protein